MRSVNLVTVVAVCFLALCVSGCPGGVAPTVGMTLPVEGTQWTRGHRVSSTSDGGYFIAGDAYRVDIERVQVLGVKLRANGSLMMVSDADSPTSNQTFDTYYSQLAVFNEPGTMILAGFATSNSNGSIQLRSSGSDPARIWSIDIESPPGQPQGVDILADGTAVLVTSQKDGPLITNAHTILISDEGVLLAQESLGLSSSLVTALEVEENRIVLGGTSSSSELGSSNADFFLRVLNESLQEIWISTYDLEGIDQLTSIAVADDDSIFAIGRSGRAASMIRVDPDGNLLWARDDILGVNAQNEDDLLWDVATTADGNIVIVGQETTTNHIIGFFPTFQVTNFVAMLDGNGDTIWYTSTGATQLYGVTVTPEGLIAATGASGNAVALVELDPNGNIVN